MPDHEADAGQPGALAKNMRRAHVGSDNADVDKTANLPVENG